MTTSTDEGFETTTPLCELYQPILSSLMVGNCWLFLSFAKKKKKKEEEEKGEEHLPAGGGPFLGESAPPPLLATAGSCIVK